VADSNNAPDDAPVTVVIARRPKKGKERELEAFLNGISKDAAHFPGYLGVSLLCPSDPSDPEYRAILKFDSLRNYRSWEESETRRRWLKLGDDITTDPPQIQILSGLETWFALPGAGPLQPPPRYKMMVVAWLAVFPLSALIGYLMGPLSADWPTLLRSFVFSLVLTPIMTYFGIPRMSRLFSRWLYPNAGQR
jgi:hypothetical protein